MNYDIFIILNSTFMFGKKSELNCNKFTQIIVDL